MDLLTRYEEKAYEFWYDYLPRLNEGLTDMLVGLEGSSQANTNGEDSQGEDETIGKDTSLIPGG